MRSTLGQQLQIVKVSTNKSLLLRTAPAFELPFGGNRIGNTIEHLMENQRHRSPSFGVAAENAIIMLRNTTFEASASRSYVIAAIDAAKNVDECRHPLATLILRDAALRAAPQDEVSV